MGSTEAFESDVRALARRIAEEGRGTRAGVFRMSWWSDRAMGWAMEKPAFKTQLFRFVDVFPAIGGHADVLRHLDEYFDGEDVPKIMSTGLGIADRAPFGGAVSASVAKRNIVRMAEQFIVGNTPDEALRNLRRLWDEGRAYTCDLLGEKTVVEADADRYAERVRELLDVLARGAVSWSSNPVLESDDLGAIPRVNVSIKPTALATHYQPLTADLGIAGAKERLRPILRQAQSHGALVHFDMEHYDVKDMTLRLFQELLDEPEFGTVHTGIVVQAYLKDARRDLAQLIEWSRGRTTPITVRLVKGAYWDSETVHCRAADWPSPVFEHKAETDASYEACIRLMHDNHLAIRSAFGSHNLRSLAYAMSYARAVGVPENGFEIQLLYGMAEPIHAALTKMGMRVRVYAPVGDMVPGMAYLVRRLLENTSNEGFVRAQYADGRSLDSLVAAPDVDALPEPAPAAGRSATNPAQPGGYDPEPMAEWRRHDVRATFAAAVSDCDAALREPVMVHAVINGRSVEGATTDSSVDPGEPTRTLAWVAECSVAQVDEAVAGAKDAQREWGQRTAAERAAVLFKAASFMRQRRTQLVAVEVFEGGRPWAEADAEVCEAIDFLEYYGREARRLDDGGIVQSPAGETNRLRYQPKGVVAVIAPWNFPLAIPTGMVSAALVMGNAVVFKPAEQTPLVASKLVEALAAAGLPDGVLQFVPGRGEIAGARLVEHPDVHLIVFTGSAAVGLQIQQRAAIRQPGQNHLKSVIAELGGKNALIIDDDADPDQAVPAAAASAFGYSGQKCSALSRLIVHDRIYDDVVSRLVGLTKQLVIGHARDMGTEVGPVIDADAQQRLLYLQEHAHEVGKVRVWRTDLPTDGFFVGPMVVDEVDPLASIARDELFGPVLCVFRAHDFDHAMALANDTPFALTAGLFSRSPAHIDRASSELRGGNIYVNRGITGAVVGRQPFGGYGMSGLGAKAGGPDYLLRFCEPRVVTENTMRQGFAPETA